jgi:hypothetical protein
MSKALRDILVIFLIINPLVGLACSVFINKSKVKILLVFLNSVVSIIFVLPMILLGAFIFSDASFAP